METVVNSILPVFLLVAFGYVLRRRNIMQECTEDFLNSLAYYLLLPSMIFISIYKADFSEIFSAKIIAGLYAAAFAVFLIAAAAAKLMPREKRGGFVLPSFRTNIAYIGFPVIMNAYGAKALAEIGMITGFIAPFLIILSIIYLNIQHREMAGKAGSLWGHIVKDPLVISSIAGIAFSYFRLPLPKFAVNTVDMLASMGSPLILMSVGAGLKISTIKNDRLIIAFASAFKLFLQPLMVYALFRFLIPLDNEMHFKVAVMTFAFPSALSTYIMVKQYKSDHEMTAAIIMVTTLLSIFTMSAWILILAK
ncbi:MAG TPA: AEC family transporter [Candidatus Goldiibacteriota bacterium]|nr:AEC family transporter [Candidatus Goldiibacteriota bacterium]